MIYKKLEPIGASLSETCSLSGVGGENWVLENLLGSLGENSNTLTRIGPTADLAFLRCNGGKKVIQTFMVEYQDAGVYESECCRGRDYAFNPNNFIIDVENDLYLEDIQWS